MTREPRLPGLRRIFRLATRRSIGRDVEDEIRFHLDARIDELVARGHSPDAARELALREYGDVEASRAELRAVDRRRAGRLRRADWRDALGHDLRYAVRALRRGPGFAAVVVVTLGLGIGANATMFGIIDRLLLRPPALLRDPGTTGRVYFSAIGSDGVPFTVGNTSYKRYLELKAGTRSFSEMAAVFNTDMVIGSGAEAEQLHVGQVSASFWPFFGVRPLLGRFFLPEEDRVPAGTDVVVLGEAYWRARMGGDSAVLGRRLAIGSRDYTIIGVAPRGFSGTSASRIAAYIPITSAAAQYGDQYYQNHNMRWLEIVARRRQGVSVEAASADLTAGYRRSMAAAPEARPLEQTRPQAMLESIVFQRGPRRDANTRVATWLGGMAVIVLLIACANVANLLVARALRRRREIAVRIALGAGRARLLRQLLTESLVLAVLGGAAGMLIAHWGGGVLRRLLLPDVEWGNTLADLRTLAATAIAATVTGVLAGIAPIAQTRRSGIAGDLKSGTREGTRRHSGLRTALLVTQAALSVVLLVGAGLFVRSLHRVRSLDLGYDPRRVLYVTIDDRGGGNPWRRGEPYFAPYFERARSLPGVEVASYTVTVPFWMRMSEDFYVPGIDSTQRLGEFATNAVGARYFETMGIRVLRGRPFSDADRAGAPPVTIISEAMAKRVWPGRDALGQCMRVGADTMPCSTVVGVVENTREGDLRQSGAMAFYVPTAQRKGTQVSGLLLRTRGEAADLAPVIRRELQRTAPAGAYVTVRGVQEMVEPEVRPWRLGATMFGAFGLLALVMAAVGLYSVIAYDVAQRRHELGVRVALGARAADLVRLVLVQGVRVAIVGVALGSAIALAAGRRIGELLYEVRPADPATFVTVALTLLLVAAAASLIPAWRAARVNPTEALRTD